jgi:ferrous iron transport protein B
MTTASTLDAPARGTRRLTAALVGNPNTGKTTLFNALSGLRQRVGNYPGVTVETKKGQMTCAGQPFDLIDLPGTYSLAARSPDEMVAVDVILGQQPGEARPDVVVSIVDASNLERNLYLTTQALELGVPVVVALNMIDVAQDHGLRIDAARLAKTLGVPVVPIQANRGRGLDQLRGAIADAARGGAVPRGPTFPEAFEREVAGLEAALGGDVPLFLVRRLLLDIGGYTEQRFRERRGECVKEQVGAARARLTEAGCAVPAVEARSRYAWIREVLAGCVQRPVLRPVTWTDRLDKVLTHRVWGTLIFLAVMFLVFQAIFTGARPLMKWIDAGKGVLAEWTRATLPVGPFSSLLAGGVIEGVGSVLVFLPQILILFAFIAFLEDCGYMARAAFLMDRLMSRCGLSGKSFIPLLSSMACAVPGILATRVIEDRRDRLATILVAPLMTCSARLPVYVLLTGAFLTVGYPWWLPGVVMFALYALGLILAPLVALVLKRTLLRGEAPVFLLEMPAYKRPSPKLVLRRMFDAGWAFVWRAGTLILASMLVVWALLYFPAGHPDGGPTYDQRAAAAERQLDNDKEAFEQAHDMKYEDVQKEIKELEGREEKTPEEEKRLAELQGWVGPIETAEKDVNELYLQWRRQSLLGQVGRFIEPAVRPLGWDWRIGVATLASFPAREVVVGTLGVLFQQGKVEADDILDSRDVSKHELSDKLRGAKWERTDRPLFTVPTALSIMVFFALCMQCASTLAVMRRETRSWRWPAFAFLYMTALAYVGALLTYQVGRLFL